jgi:1-deoxyxylulose-5-phosphate synthase
MDQIRLGRSGLYVSRLGLGMMSYGEDANQPWMLDETAARPIVHRAVEGGFTFFDTADMYSQGASEVATRRLLRKLLTRDQLVIATKVYFPTTPGPNGRGLSRKHILAAIDASLGRLQLDHVDLYQIHRWDPETPIEETMEALHDVVKAGKARYLGASSMNAWQFAKAQRVAERHGWTQFVSMQNHYNLVYREEEREMIPQCIDLGVGVIPWSPLARGFLAGTRTRWGERRTRLANRFTPGRAVRPPRRLRCRGSSSGDRRRARRPARPGRAGVATAQARGHRADRRSDEDRAPRRRASCHGAETLARRDRSARRAVSASPCAWPRRLKRRRESLAYFRLASRSLYSSALISPRA